MRWLESGMDMVERVCCIMSYSCVCLHRLVCISQLALTLIPVYSRASKQLPLLKGLAQLVDTLLDTSPHARRAEEKASFLLNPRKYLLSSHLSLFVGNLFPAVVEYRLIWQ